MYDSFVLTEIRNIQDHTGAILSTPWYDVFCKKFWQTLWDELTSIFDEQIGSFQRALRHILDCFQSVCRGIQFRSIFFFKGIDNLKEVP